MSQTHWVMDYETNINCFLAVFEHYKTDEEHVFTIGPLRNDLIPFLKFLDENIEENQWHISFNGLAFDAQITEFILVQRSFLLTLDGETVGRKIYDQAQDAIERLKTKGRWAQWSERDLSIKQIDLFKLNHWDNSAKMSSLKWIQCSMRWHNVQDMPIDHTQEITTVAQLKQIAMYCRNDVASTKQIMELSSKQIELRGKLTNDYNIPLYSASEPRISKELFMHFLSKKLKIPKYELKNFRTYRGTIVVKDLILDYIKFRTPEFQKLHKSFANLRLDAMQLKGQFKDSVEYKGVKITFGLGGVHGARKGIYEPNEHMTIISSDVTSFYPNLAIRNGWHPAQLPKKAFLDQYEWFFTERRKIPKSDPRNYVYKIILNSTYGLSNDQHSFLYDPEFTMRITINGQLSLMMLYERIMEEIPGAIPILQNTDGVDIMIPTKYKDKYMQICADWEKLTQLELEHDEYQKLVVPDVNNYIGIFTDQEVTKEKFLSEMKESPDNLFKRIETTDGFKYTIAKTKAKGRFDIHKELHKNHSFLVVSKALFNYFVHGIDPKKTVYGNKNILDFCGQTRGRGIWKFKQQYVNSNREVVEDDLQKTLRYFISNKGGKILKINPDGRILQVHAKSWVQRIFNQFIEMPFEDHDINHMFYLSKVNKEIHGLQADIFSNQVKLF